MMKATMLRDATVGDFGWTAPYFELAKSHRIRHFISDPIGEGLLIAAYDAEFVGQGKNRPQKAQSIFDVHLTS